MRILCFLLLTFCLLFSQIPPGIGQRSDHYRCVHKGGTCNFSPCPLFQKVEGTCYNRRAKCCMG
ncbi:beta-defensin 1 [Choloepus didactylus]|uniref:beta-defensin 1 n=1 Tax=Choloepus didactylus TaxID=27675 RepID=UPI00189D5E34|nr:beta-defensin 1 [Choloepus didactylus]